MRIVVNDTNIFIDLYNIDLLDAFFELPFEIHTVDFIINELSDIQRNKINTYNDKGVLTIAELEPEDLENITMFKTKIAGNVTFVDCAVLFYAMENGYTLLTGDRQLRNRAISNNVPVRGIIYIFDQLVENNIINKDLAKDKLQELYRTNQRLPIDELNTRLKQWSK